MTEFCFFEVEVAGERVGRLVFELFDELVPKAAENFRALCTGEKGTHENGTVLAYKGSKLHRIVGNTLYGGDITTGNGIGGNLSIYGGCFADENFKPKHLPGSLSMYSTGPNTNGTQFFVCLDPSSQFDGKHQVIGKVVEGQMVLERIAKTPLGNNNYPRLPIVITECGVMKDLQ
eukprot:TRINITY_DN95191_c0_g1_i1.p1 TRINITY_DN95191_c0_g1~~TRINITY_DN95191_c0_g1_i1.p1  ORF type:complete len:194 (-),score=9.98 TRINITY_DN95191_c0_g1_i1:122-646(-)